MNVKDMSIKELADEMKEPGRSWWNGNYEKAVEALEKHPISNDDPAYQKQCSINEADSARVREQETLDRRW